MSGKETILVIGSCGQLGTELVVSLQKIYGAAHVVAADIRRPDNPVFQNGPFEILDILDQERLTEIVAKYKPTQVYHLAALLSATAEQKPEFGWKLNMDGLFNVLNLARDGGIIKKIYWPSSIAVLGQTPFETIRLNMGPWIQPLFMELVKMRANCTRNTILIDGGLMYEV